MTYHSRESIGWVLCFPCSAHTSVSTPDKEDRVIGEWLVVSPGKGRIPARNCLEASRHPCKQHPRYPPISTLTTPTARIVPDATSTLHTHPSPHLPPLLHVSYPTRPPPFIPHQAPPLTSSSSTSRRFILKSVVHNILHLPCMSTAADRSGHPAQKPICRDERCRAG
jgi:hypothetical protein